MAPTQPKRPVGGAYGVFLAEKREEFTKACAGQKASAISQMAGAEWKKLSAEDKKPFEEKYKTNQATYNEELKSFLDAGGVVEKGLRAQRSAKRKEKEAGGKKKKDPDAPKKPAGGAYGRYLAANREEIVKMLPAGHKCTAVTKKAGELWGKMTADEKKPYEDAYLKLKAEYEKAIEEYKKNNPSAEEEKEEDDAEDNEEEEERPKPTAKKAKPSPVKAKAKAKVNVREIPVPSGGRAKRARIAVPEGPAIEPEVLDEAKKLGHEAALKNLAGRFEKGLVSASRMLEVLKECDGLVNKAKNMLMAETAQ